MRSSVPVVGAEEVALGEQFGAERLGALEVAHQQPAQDEQAEAAADALGGDGRVPAPARERTAPATAAARASAAFDAEPAGEVAVGVEQPHGLNRALRIDLPIWREVRTLTYSPARRSRSSSASSGRST